MFYCEECRAKNDWPGSFFEAIGPCEICHKKTGCHDVHHSLLPLPPEEYRIKGRASLLPPPPEGCISDYDSPVSPLIRRALRMRLINTMIQEAADSWADSEATNPPASSTQASDSSCSHDRGTD